MSAEANDMLSLLRRYEDFWGHVKGCPQCQAHFLFINSHAGDPIPITIVDDPNLKGFIKKARK